MTFRVGQKVVCVDALSAGQYLPSGFHGDGHLNGLRLNAIYTIRDIGTCLGVEVCRLNEIIRDFEPYYEAEAWFARARFRPVVERKTDISIFTEML